MTREIKFRAWDKKRTSMYNVSGFSFEAGKASLNSDIRGSHWVVELSDIELLQFTGLKDKNGVEIYEGDIVNVPYNRIGNIEVKYGGHSNPCGFNIGRYKLDVLTVVGNIHTGLEE